jgi:hypothetical protein
VENDLQFDRLMTNADWWKDEAQLETTLAGLFEAGFDGSFGISIDSYHGQESARLAVFFDRVFAIWGRKDCAEILSVTKPGNLENDRRLQALATALGGRLLREFGEPSAIANQRHIARDGSGEDDREALFVKILTFPYSASADEEGWEDDDSKDAAWFEDDWCQGPGNVFYVHPNGRVAACCGFANENEALIIGDIASDGYETLMRRAGENPQIQACYVQGLATRRRELEGAGTVFPGKTGDICFFCDWLCRKK